MGDEFCCCSLVIRLFGADAFDAEKLAIRSAGFLMFWVTGGIVEIGVGVCGFGVKCGVQFP